jgi:CubicO group peptidase (beta-lactamase class C family)
MLKPFAAILLLAHAPAPLPAQTDSPATRRAREIVALINAPVPSAVRAYVDSAFGPSMRRLPLAAHINFMMGQRQASGGLDFVEASAENSTSAIALVVNRITGDPTGLSVRVESDPPYRISGIGQRPAPRNPGPALRVASDQAMATELERVLAKLSAADVFSGAVLLAKGDRVIFSGAYGQANKDFGAPNTAETRFNLGSMNKMFTAVAVLQLAERGKLRLDDPLAKFVPDFPSPEAAKKIRIEHLLTHTSGLGSYFNDAFFRASRARYRTVDEMMELAAGDSLAFEPGTRWSYSNTGMLVLGKVIEAASGQDYFSYVRDNIYGPAGMTRSDSYELDYVNDNLAVGYDFDFQEDGTKRVRNNIFMHVIRGGPAGGGYSTVGDLHRFALALESGRLVGKESVDRLTSPKPELGSPEYGYGFGVDTATAIVGHSGGFPGISSNLDMFRRSGYIAVVQSNYSRASAPVTEKIRALVAARVGAMTP